MAVPTTRRRSGIGMLLLALAVAGAASPAMAGDPLPSRKLVILGADGTAADTVRWTTSSGGQAVLKVEGDEEDRWLVLTIDGRSTTRLGGPRSHPLGNWGHEYELRDEATGWWARYSGTTPDRPTPDLDANRPPDQSVDLALQALVESRAETRHEWWTSDGILVRRTTTLEAWPPDLDGPNPLDEVVVELRGQGLDEGMPSATQNAVRFLLQMRSRSPHLDRYWEGEFDFLELLADALSEPAADGRRSP